MGPISSKSTAPTHQPHIAGSPKAQVAARAALRWMLLFLAVALILLALLVSAARVGSPLLSGQIGTVESRLSDYLKTPVSIGELSLTWDGYSPKLSAGRVSIRESEDRQITVDSILLDANLIQTLISGKPIINELTLIGAELVLEVSDKGQLAVHGVAKRDAAPTDGKTSINLLSWLLSTDRVGLENARVKLINSSNAEPLEIKNVNVLAVNDGQLHQLRIDMELPDAIGQTLELGIDLRGNTQDLSNSESDVYVKATGLSVDALRTFKAGRYQGLDQSTTGIARLDARVQVELWGHTAQGKLQSARGKLDAVKLEDLSTNEVVLDRLFTDVVFLNKLSGWQVQSDVLTLQRGDETTEVSNVVYEHKPSADTAWRLTAAGETLPLDAANKLVLSLFSESTNLPRALWLAQASPSGTLVNWNAAFALIDGKPNFSLDSAFYDLQLAAAYGVPGISNLGGAIKMLDNKGKVTMQGSDLTIDIPQAYSAPIKLASFRSELDLDLTDPVRTSIDGDMQILDDGISTASRVQVQLAPDESPRVYVQSQFDVDNIKHAERYLPSRLLRPKTTQWLKQALLKGKAANGELLLFGNIAQFPFTEGKGVFKVGFDVVDAEMDYLTGWPRGKNLQGRFEINGASLEGTAKSGTVGTMNIQNLVASIPALTKPALIISSRSNGVLSEMVDFANTGPLKNILGPVFSDISATGRATMDLGIKLPLSKKAVFNTVASAQAKSARQLQPVNGLEVKGSVKLNKNEIAFGRSKLSLSNVKGAVGFTHDGFSMDKLTAFAFGQKVELNASTKGKGNNRRATIKVTGSLRGDDVLSNYEIPLNRFVDGQSYWRISIIAPMTSAAAARDGVQIIAGSNLLGTEMILPPPLNKVRSRSRQMQISTRIKADNSEPVWRIKYGDNTDVVVHTAEGSLQSLTMQFGGAKASTKAHDGVRIEGNIASLAMDGLATSLAGLIEDLPSSNEKNLILPVSVNLNIASLEAGVESLGPAVVRVNTDDTFINAVVQNKSINGNVRYPRAHWKQDVASLVRIQSVDKKFFDALSSGPEQPQGNELDPRLLPPIDARVSSLTWDQLTLTDLVVRSSPSVAGLNIDTFGFAADNTQLIGEGYWRLKDPQSVNASLLNKHVSKLNLTLQSDDYGVALANFGFGGTVDEGEGDVTASIVWPGPAYKPALESMTADMKMQLKKGRILKVDPGAARLAGLFAIESIPRRLGLDFKDLVKDGLDYETLTGQLQLANGIVRSQLIQLNGGVGVVDITGESNLLSREYNQTITVLPRVSSALPIIVIISGGATAGLGALFAGGLLKAIGLDLDRIGLREYSLTGSWDDPQLTNVPFNPDRRY